MAKTFEEMTKAELAKVAETYGLTDKIAENAKDANKITNAEYVTVLNEYKDAQDKTAPAKVETKEANREELIQIRAEDLYRQIPVIVTDHDNSVEVKDDDGRRGIELYWGNSMGIGQTERFFNTGERQYLTRGLLKKMKRMTIPEFKKDKYGKEIAVSTRKRFVITEVEGMTEDEITALGKKQQLSKLND